MTARVGRHGRMYRTANLCHRSAGSFVWSLVGYHCHVPGAPGYFNISFVGSQPESQFAAAYEKGVHKTKYWEYYYEDAMNLIAKLPGVAAHIYRTTYHGGKLIGFKKDLDWAANLAHMMGVRPL